MIAEGQISNLRIWMEDKPGEGCHTMNTSLRTLLAEGKIAVQDARNATTDRIGFVEP
jgi:twitching motility protein PilT